jgi:DNA-3-methyladenine glycosylase I
MKGLQKKMGKQQEFAQARRCSWCTEDPLYLAYHDEEWGVPVYEDSRLFEMLVLEGAQAGLSWLTILKKRETYRRVFQGFDFRQVALYDESRMDLLLREEGIVRNRLKILSVIRNARAAAEVERRAGSFSAFLWSFVDGKPIQNSWKSQEQVPAFSPQSISMARELKGLGFGFVGPVICYSFMQAVGMVNDHEVGCFRHAQIRDMCSRAKGLTCGE